MICLLNPKNFAISKAIKNKGLLNAGWKAAETSECGHWLEIRSEMTARRIRCSTGGVAEVICFHVKTTMPGQGQTIIGPFETTKARPEAAVSAAMLLANLGLPLEMLVFHVDMLEFGTEHSPRESDGRLILPVGGERL